MLYFHMANNIRENNNQADWATRAKTSVHVYEEQHHQSKSLSKKE